MDRIQISGIRYDDKSLARYAWDHRDRLVQVVVDGEPTAYSYDYRNRLVRRNDEIFVHDGWQTVMRLKNGSVAQRYLWGAKQDELLCENDSHVLCDHLSSVQKVVDGNGKVVSSLKYNAFGELLNEPDDEIAFAYTGKLFDAKTGLQWNINRWYDPKVGRWISEDPIGFRGGDTNLAVYARNSIISTTDRVGLWGERVHYGDTFDWAIGVGFSAKGARAIAEKDRDTDVVFGYGMTSPAPWPLGSQSYHFNTYATSSGQDSRYVNFKRDYADAQKYCKCPKDDPANAVFYFGIGLHAYQDIEAHGDYGRGYVINQSWSFHNSGTPYSGQSWKTPDDPEWDVKGTTDGIPWRSTITNTSWGLEYAEFEKKASKNAALRWNITKKKSIDTLKGFHGFISAKGGPKCKAYFL